MKEYYTYAYLREDGTPYYIGKGKGRRINFPYQRRAKIPPKERRIFLKKNLTEEEAIKHEIYMIDIFGRKDLGTGILRNLTHGGEISESRKGRFSGSENPCYGRKLTEEDKNRIIQRHYKYYTFISPDGKVMTEYTTIREFCRKNNLERKSVKFLVEGKFKQHKGWKFVSLDDTWRQRD